MHQISVLNRPGSLPRQNKRKLQVWSLHLIMCRILFPGSWCLDLFFAPHCPSSLSNYIVNPSIRTHRSTSFSFTPSYHLIPYTKAASFYPLYKNSYITWDKPFQPRLTFSSKQRWTLSKANRAVFGCGGLFLVLLEYDGMGSLFDWRCILVCGVRFRVKVRSAESFAAFYPCSFAVSKDILYVCM